MRIGSTVRKILLRAKEKGILLHTHEMFSNIVPAVAWETEMVSKKLKNMAAKILRQNTKK